MLPDGRLLIGSGDRWWLADDPAGSHFRPVGLPEELTGLLPVGGTLYGWASGGAHTWVSRDLGKTWDRVDPDGE